MTEPVFGHIRHFTYDADQHCVQHAIARFGEEALFNDTAEDGEGNGVGVCFNWDECLDDPDYCAECLYEQWASDEYPNLTAQLQAEREATS